MLGIRWQRWAKMGEEDTKAREHRFLDRINLVHVRSMLVDSRSTQPDPTQNPDVLPRLSKYMLGVVVAMAVLSTAQPPLLRHHEAHLANLLGRSC